MNFFLLLGIVGAVAVSVIQGLAAHGGFLRVPWVRFLRNPNLVGGLPAILFNLVWFMFWVLSVGVASGVVGFATTFLRPGAAWAADQLGVSIANTPGASLGLLTVGAALYFCLGTAHTCRRLSESPPQTLMIDSSGPTPEMGPSLAASYWRAQGLLPLAAFVLTTVMVPFYQYFLDRRGVLENGCVRLLLQDFGSHKLVRYCTARCTRGVKSPDERFVDEELRGFLDNDAFQNDHVRAYAIATVLVRKHGFDGARSRIVQDHTRPPRLAERAPADSQGHIELAGVGWPCLVGDISKDGSGLGVRLRRESAEGYGSDWGPIAKWLRAGAKVTAILGDRRFELVVSRFSFNDDVLTLGLSAQEPAQRKALLESVRPRAA